MRKIYPILFLIALVVLAFWKPLFHGEYTLLVGGGDMCAQWYPWHAVAAHWLKNNTFLIWDPYVYSGVFKPGEVQPGIFYPLHWLFWLFPALDGGMNLDAMQLLILVHFFLAALFVYLLAKSFNLSFWGSALAGIAFALSGFLVQLYVRLHAFFGFVWMPLVLLSFREAINARRLNTRIRWILCGGVATALSFLAGLHLAAVHTGLLLLFYGIFAVAHDWKGGNWRQRAGAAVALGGVAVTALLISALQWLPSVEWATQVLRWVGADQPVRWGQQIPYSVLENTLNFHPGDVITLAIPYWGLSENIYVGSAVVFFALVGLLFVRRAEARFFGAMMFIYFFLSWGRFSALHGWLNTFVPGMWFAREVSFYFVPVQLCLALLAGWGLDHLVDCYAGSSAALLRKFVKIAGWGIALVVVALSVVCIAASASLGEVRIQRLMTLAAYLVVLGFLVFLLHSGWIRPTWFRMLAFALVFVDLASHISADIRKDSDEGSVQTFWKRPASADFLIEQRRKEVFRVDDPEGLFPPNFGDVWQLEATMGHAATMLARYFDFRSAGWEPSSNASALLNVRYFVSSLPVPGMKRVFGESPAIYQNPRAVPRAYVAARYRCFNTDKETLAWIRSPLFAPRQTVLLTYQEQQILPREFLQQVPDDQQGIEVTSYAWQRADEKKVRKLASEADWRRFVLHQAAWGWSEGDSIVVYARAPQKLPHCYLVVNYFPTSEQVSRVFVGRESAGVHQDLPLDLPGSKPGQAVAEVEQSAALDLGAVGPEGLRISLKRTAECGADIDSIRVARDAPPPDERPAGEVAITSFEPNSLKMAATLNRCALVVVSDVYYPGWEAVVDGKPAPILQADYVLKAVPVNAGVHTIELRFRPKTFLWGLLITIVTCISIVVFLCVTPNR
jgi:hypothetical protein